MSEQMPAQERTPEEVERGHNTMDFESARDEALQMEGFRDEKTSQIRRQIAGDKHIIDGAKESLRLNPTAKRFDTTPDGAIPAENGMWSREELIDLLKSMRDTIVESAEERQLIETEAYKEYDEIDKI